MKRQRRTVLFFGICALAVLGAMAWLTVEIRHAQHREAAALQEAELQEAKRRALWRLDSFVQVFVATESARPHLYYNSLFSPEQAYYMVQGEPGGQWAVACADDYRVPSPLLRAEPEFCLLHFQVESHGDDSVPSLGSPRYPPTAENRAFAINTQNVRHDELVQAAGLLEQLKAMARPEQLIALARHPSHEPRVSSHPAVINNPLLNPARTVSEWNQRQQTAQQAMNVQQSLNDPLSMDARAIEVSSLTPVWLSTDEHNPQLVLLRTVRVQRVAGVQELVQGVWVDWKSLRAALLEKVADLFPDAQLVPANDIADNPERLATIPAVLRTGMPASAAAGFGAARTTMLYVAWAGVIAALIAVGIVVRAILDLGERRGRFVSAVTHELRTPLTTFCLYSEMLADGMVRDESARRNYTLTLKHESQRLAKIVENVLCYARLAEVRGSASPQLLAVVELIDRITPALTRRAEEAGMLLLVDVDAAADATIEADPQTVERILMNLVDNACKYAHGHAGPDGAVDNRIHLTAHLRPTRNPASATLELRVTDHGPGIPHAHRRRIFKPFNRARTDTVSSAPGLGLGLSLARGLARELGGDLRLAAADTHSGTVMSLVIPASVVTAPVAAPSAATA